MPRWSRSLPARTVRSTAWDLLLRPLFSVFVRLEVRGRENIPHGGGPYLVVANHGSLLDTPAVRAALPRFVRARLYPAMAVEVLPAHFEPERHGFAARLRSGALYAAASTFFAAYPMPQSRGYRPSLEYTGELLDAGLSPLIFPEGRMTRTGEMLPFKSGIGLLAVETQAQVLPIHLSGLFEVLPPESRWPKRGGAVASIGRPILPAENGGDPASIARRIEAAVRALRPGQDG
jgi:1-acyl-sn-glycerol-3-phosphate acyltransferase